MLTFWVLTKKPRFAENHNLLVTGESGRLDLGAARYAAKPRENMEYLNFEISREDLAKIAQDAAGRFSLGDGWSDVYTIAAKSHRGYARAF